MLIINKTDLTELVRADLGVMERDSKKMRGRGPFVFARALHGYNLDVIVDHIKIANERALQSAREDRR